MATANLGLIGPYELARKRIGETVAPNRIGNYALGRYGTKNVEKFIVLYVGRSDSDVQARLLEHAAEKKHKLFRYSYAESAAEAFEKECRNYHDFEAPENDVHPARPEGTSLTCPRCDFYR
ncbi:MAG: hypothetical protein IH945_10270 [Armatimonadetes bacterium]|nr:hypothetical protein [Armatimonadota bacterium]